MYVLSQSNPNIGDTAISFVQGMGSNPLSSNVFLLLLVLLLVVTGYSLNAV